MSSFITKMWRTSLAVEPEHERIVDSEGAKCAYCRARSWPTGGYRRLSPGKCILLSLLGLDADLNVLI